MTEETLQEIIDGLYESCYFCKGTGIQEFHPKYNCNVCEGKGKRPSYFAEQLLNFLSKNLVVKLS